MTQLLNTYQPLSPLLADYWDKPLAKLPKALQVRVKKREAIEDKTHVISIPMKKREAIEDKTRVILIPNADGSYPAWEEEYATRYEGDFLVHWDNLTPEQRRQQVVQIDCRHDPAYQNALQAGFELVWTRQAVENEIRKWEAMRHDYDPTKAKIQDDRLAELRAELAKIEKQQTIDAGGNTPQSAPKVETVPTPSGDDWKVQARTIADELFDKDTKAGVRDSLATKNSVGHITGGYCLPRARVVPATLSKSEQKR